MPNIFVHLPHDAYTGSGRQTLTQAITDAACAAEQIPPQAQHRFWCWVLLEDMMPHSLHCGGRDVSTQMLQCIVRVVYPAGVLDATMKQAYIAGLHNAFEKSRPEQERRKLALSVILDEVPEGHWGVNGRVWRLPDFAKEAGFMHLQHLSKPIE